VRAKEEVQVKQTTKHPAVTQQQTKTQTLQSAWLNTSSTHERCQKECTSIPNNLIEAVGTML